MHSQSAGQTCRPGGEFENWRRMLQLLHPLYGHDSLRSEQAYLSDLVSTTGQPPENIITSMRRWIGSSKPSFFSREGRKFTRMHLELRRQDILIHTDNAFSRDFLPPDSGRAAAAFSALIRYFHAYMATSPGPCASLSLALSFYLSFLTIHPFTDGNGRTARFFFGACASVLEERSPTAILGLALMHRNRGSMFHATAKIARLGDFTPFGNLFRDSLLLAESIFADDIQAISCNRAGSYPSDAELSALMNIRSRLNANIRI